MTTLKVDTREPEKVTQWLSKHGVEFERTCLKTGDFSVEDEIVIERKTWVDFIGSIVDGRLMRQADRLKEFKHPYILISGDFERALMTTKMHRHCPLGAIASLSIKRGINIVCVPTDEDLFYLISRIVKKYEDTLENDKLVS